MTLVTKDFYHEANEGVVNVSDDLINSLNYVVFLFCTEILRNQS